MSSPRDLETLYELLAELRERVGGLRYLRVCNGRNGWPKRGVYFFFDEDESRGSGSGLRVVRVGTHALHLGNRTTLWGRLHNHKGHEGGRNPGGGNHRGSVFRLHVGSALLLRDGDPNALLPTWIGRSAPGGEAAELECEVERRVSRYIRDLPFLWIGVLDEACPTSDRGLIEASSIALLSTKGREVDPPGEGWLGHHARRSAIVQSGLWNVEHVGETYEPVFLKKLEGYISQM